MLVGFARYSRDRSFAVITANRTFTLSMAAGSVVGAYVGARLVSFVPGEMLVTLLAVILVLAALKVWRHR
jgi:uncharacterized membrane protein YfcA